MKNTMNIAGAGGGQSSRTPVEAPDSLRSAQFANIVEVISEGEIEGLVNGMKSIYLDGTPIENESGSKNFEGAEFIFRNGSQVQGEDGLSVETGGVQSTSQIAVELKKNMPVTRRINNPDIDWVKVVIGVPQLTKQDQTTGDTTGSTVEYTIDLQSASGGYVTKVAGEITGKTTSFYKREHKIMLEGNGPWDIRVTRTTPDSLTATLQDKTFWAEMVEGIDVKLSYPNSAVCALRINSEQFRSIPARGYHVRGLRVKVPTNYDPATRTYSGTWNGSFKIAWTDNPAWCFYDLLTNTRYGLGENIDASQADKWTLYQIAKYCDQLIPDGFGGMEPRFTCNLYLQGREDAFKVVNSMASIFRGMVYYADGEILFSQDAPTDPVAIFSSSNVIEGMFTYQGADRRARHTVALVSWNDPTDMYRQKIEYVSDPDGLARWGAIQTELLAVGCTSQGQANRMGRWLLFTEQQESETVSFRAGMDAVRCAPGDVIKIQDPVRSGVRRSGRVVSATTSTIELDSQVEMQSGISHTVSVMLSSGVIHDASISYVPGKVSSISFSPAAPSAPLPGAMWLITSSNLAPELWRVISVLEVEPSIVEINALYYNPGKFEAIENNIALDPVPTSNLKSRPGAVTNLSAKSEIYRLNDAAYSTRIAVGWTAPAGASSYTVFWRREQENEHIEETRLPGFEINNVPAGSYEIRVVAKNNLGITGDSVAITYQVSASGIAPNVQNIRLSPNFTGRDMPVVWDAVPGAIEYVVEIAADTGVYEVEGVPNKQTLRQERVSEPFYTYTYGKNLHDLGPRRELTVRVRAKTLAGESADWAEETFVNEAPDAPLGLSLEAGPGQISIVAIRPPDEDLAGMMVWMDTSPGFIADDSKLVYQGADNAFMKTGLEAGSAYYFRAAFYDAFGQTELNVSSEVSAIPLAKGGVTRVSELPESPVDIGGELALFLDVSEPEQRGLYGWNGTEWVNTRELLNGSVTSDKLAEGAVDFTKLAAGAVQARNLAVRKHFLY